MTAALLLTILGIAAPPIAEPYSGPIELAAPAPRFPGEAIQYDLANGQRIGIVPEKPRYGNVTATRMVSSRGMGCCLVPVTTTRTILVNHPTPLPEIQTALKAAGVSQDDVLYDLGSGDGRVCILAAKEHGCFAVGLDKRPEAVKLSNENAKLNDVEDLCSFYAFPIKGQRLAHATVVYCYLEPSTLAQVVKQVPDNVRAAISYKHPWPGGRGQKVGGFYIWKRALH